MRNYTLNSSIKRAFKGKTLESIPVDKFVDYMLKDSLATILGVPGSSAGAAGAARGMGVNNGQSMYPDNPAMYTSAQIDAGARALAARGSRFDWNTLGANVATMGLQFGLNEASAAIAYQRQNDFYNNHLSMSAKVAEYEQAGLNPMALAGAGVGATSAPSVPQSQPTDVSSVLGTLLNYKVQQKQNDINEERNRIQEKGIDSQISLRAEQQITQEKINQWFDANQIVNIGKAVAETNLISEKLNTEVIEQRLKAAGIEKEYAEAALKFNQAIAQAIDNNYRDAWNRNTLALQNAQTAMAYSQSAVNTQTVQNLIQERENLVLQGFQIAAKTEEIQNMSRVLGFQGDITKFNAEHVKQDYAWKRVGQAIDAVEGITGSAANVVSCVTGIPRPRKPIGF